VSRLSLKKVLMRRDGMEDHEAEDVIQEVENAIIKMIEEGEGIIEIEDYLQDELGLEPDYLMDLNIWP